MNAPINGWEAGLESDSVLRQFAEAMAARVGATGIHSETFAANDTGRDSWIANESVVRVVPSADVFAEIAAWYPAGRKFGCFIPFILTEIPQGYELGGHPPFMVRPAGGQAPASTLVCRRLSGDEEHQRAGEILGDAFEVTDIDMSSVFSPAVEASNFALYGAFDDGELVGTASSWPSHGVNLIEMVGVPKSMHRRGIGAAVTWAATMHAPDVPAVLLASDPGQPVYERMGYMRICRTTFLMGTGTG